MIVLIAHTLTHIVRGGNRTQNLRYSSQGKKPLDHQAIQLCCYSVNECVGPFTHTSIYASKRENFMIKTFFIYN